MTSHTVEAQLTATSFDAERVHVLRMRGREAISELFELTVDAVVDGAPLDRDEVLGSSVGLQLVRDGQVVRTIHGCVWSLHERFDFAAGVRQYRFVIAPRARRLTLIRTQEVFLGLSVPEIVGDKLAGVELADVDVDRATLMGTYPQREMVVQFDETDFAFVSRLCEHLGIAYFFDHRYGHDRIVVTDDVVGFGPFEGYPTLQLSDHEGQADTVRTLERVDTLVPEQFWVMDYDYRNPNQELTCAKDAAGGYAGGVFEYGASFTTAAEGQALATARAQAAEAARTTHRGTSDVLSLTAGHVYDLDGHPELDGSSLLVVAVDHDLVNPPPMQGAENAPQARYLNTFEAIPGGCMYRPPRRTPRPRIAGLLNGIVEPSEYGVLAPNADIDHRGRYRVKFFFDTAPLTDQRGSKPVRMALPYVGSDYGAHFPLHPGAEVVVGFENGDPDRPVIVGACHNHVVVPAHVTNANLQTSVIKTASGIKMQFKDDTPGS